MQRTSGGVATPRVFDARARPRAIAVGVTGAALAVGSSVAPGSRFDRSFWKYPDHAKAWKVIQLDAGHLSQNFYLSATERGYGAFVTAAINDACAERAFELDGITSGAVAVCGFGKRAAEGENVELDPLGKAVR